MFASCKKTIQSADYFGQRVELSFNSAREFRTTFGGVFSILMYLACLAFVISIGVQLILRENPSTLTSTQTQPAAPLIDIMKEEMIFALYVQDKNYNPITDPSILTITGYQYVMNRTDTSLSNDNEPIPLVNCSEFRSFFNARNFSDDYESNNLDNAVCFKFHNKTMIGGNFILSYFSNLYISVKKCNNATSAVTCKSSAEIDSQIKGSYFELYYFDWNVDPNKYDAPFNRYIANYFHILDPKSHRMVDLFFKNSKIMSNTGLIFDSYENKTKIIFDRVREQIDPSYTGDEVLELYINSSSNLTLFIRLYMKIQDFFANVGGLIQAMIIVGYVLTVYITRFDMYEHMMNCLFTFKKDQQVEKSLSQLNIDIANNKNLFKYYTIAVNKGKQNSKIVNRIEISPNNFIMRSINEDEDEMEKSPHGVPGINQQVANNASNEQVSSSVPTDKEKELNKQLETKIKQFNGQMSSNFVMSFKNKIKVLCNEFVGCKFKSRAIRLYDVSFKKLLGYLDFLRIVKLLKEFRQMKKIVFNKTQLEIFKNHNKQEIHFDELDHDDEHKEQNYYDLYKLYFKGQEKVKTDKVYKRLIQNFDKNLSTIFEKIEETKHEQ
jgi:hypothetical protein